MERSARITILGGMNEVDGNMVLLEDDIHDVKFFIDFGVNIEMYYVQYDRGESPASIQELVNLGIIPNEENLPIKNLYTKANLILLVSI